MDDLLRDNNAPTTGSLPLLLAKVKRDVLPYVDQPREDACAPLVEGTPDDFVAQHGEKSLSQLKNKVKKCPGCGKLNAFTLEACNSCGTSIRDVPISYPNNVFAGFVYGIQKGPFPFTISIRKQTASLLVFDDLLQMCPCHVNCIPTDQYVPDVRLLFENPVLGLKMVLSMYEAAKDVVKSQFLGNKSWRSKLIRGADDIDWKDDQILTKYLISGFNYPPSQYWLHLQTMLPPMTPFHYSMYLQGRHYTYGRFFPIDYILDALQMEIKIPQAGEMPIEGIIQFFEAKGLRYDEYYHKNYQRYGEVHRALSNWKAGDFSRVIVNGGDKVLNTEDLKIVEEKTQDILKEDKVALQNYGRPYKNGRPVGNYYKHAKKSLLKKFC
eukprot:CAMPEP_0197517168 /NCGR_PEP_ID=MMETSP1318-20131121/2141_1 /TAXON_ID=552666 /ORGANISM="Partenskyella glossopodia, Strain RCC365" /LENGTH=380 /DNA_ID=CAMNT_0043066505 /DNA_START=54 /DNA_END=1196 /DNA_ORIENTATION=+